MALKESGFFGFSKRLKRSSIIVFGSCRERCDPRPGAGRGSRRPPQALARACGQRGDGAAYAARTGRGQGAEPPVPPPDARKPPSRPPLLRPILDQLHVERQALQLLHHDVEGLRQPRLEDVLALHDRLVHARAARHVVGLDGQHLLQRVSGAVGLERPHLHLAEALATELRLAAERLLRDQRIRSGRAGVDLVVDQVVQLHHVHHADGHLMRERLAGAAVEQAGLAVGGQARTREELEDLLLGGAVEHRRGDVDAVRGLARQLDDVLVGERIEEIADLLGGVELLQLLAQRLDVRPAVLLELLLDLTAELARRPAEVRLEDLPHVHAARHAEGIEHDVDRRPVRQVRHVLLGQQAREDALVAVAPGHLVAHLELPLDGDEHLHHLDHAGREFFAALQAFDLLGEGDLDEVDLLLHPLDQAREIVFHALVADLDVAPVVGGDLRQHVGGDLDALVQEDLARVVREARRGLLALEELQHLLARTLADDADLVLLIFSEFGYFVFLDRAGTIVLLNTLAGEDPRIDDRALDAGRDAQARVAHLARLLAEDGAQELLLGRELRLALGCDLADQDVARLHLRADADDPRLVQVLEGLVADVRDVARDLLGAELGVARHALELLDVHRGEEVVLHDPLGDEDRVLEVVAAPGHEGDQHVAPEGQVAHLGRGAVGDHVARVHAVAHHHDRALVHAGVLVRALVLDHVVDVDARVAAVLRGPVGLDHDARRVDLLDHAVAPRDHGDARVARHHPLHAGTDQRRVGAQEGHRLALHVGAHERAVGVVVLEERDEGRRHRHELVRRHVHELDLVGRHHGELAADAGRDQVGGEVAPGVERRVRLRDRMLLLLERGEVRDLVAHPPLLDAPVGRLDEAELVHARVGRERGDEADVRSFRRLDRAHAAVVGGVDVAHLEPRTLAREPARAEGGEAALVGDLGERVRLVHELRELGGPEELLDHGRHRLVVDELLRHQRLDVLETHALLDGALHAHETDAVLVLDQLADGAHAAVAQVVDVVDLAVAVLELDEVADDLQDVLAAQRPLIEGHVDLELVVQLEASHAREVVTLGVEEEVVEEGGRGLRGGRIARTQPAVDLEDRVLGLLDLVLEERVAERGTDVGVLEEEDLHLVDAALAEELELLVGDLLVGREQDLARPRVLDVVRRDPAEHLLEGGGNLLDAGLLHQPERRPGELAALLDDQLVALRVAQVAGRLHAHQVIGHEAFRRLAAVEDDGVLAVEVVEEVLGGHAEGAQEDGGVELPPPVDTHVEDVLGVEFEVDPRAAVGDDARRVEELAAGVRLPLVVVEEHAWRAMELRDDHPLSPVDHERPVAGHERDLAEVDLLLLDVLDGANAALGIDVPDDELDRDLEGGGERHPPLVALLHVVLRLGERVAHELEGGGLVEVLDREDRLEDRLEALVLAGLGGHVLLQELLVAALLDLDQVRDVDDLLDAPERPPEAEVVRNAGCCRHRRAHHVSCVSHLSSTVPPASSSFFLSASASAFGTPSLTGLGAPSTRSLASLRPSPVISRTTLMTWLFFSPAPERTTVKSSFSGAAAAAAAAGPAAAIATGAAADTPSSDSSSFTSVAASMRLMFFKKSFTCSRVTSIALPFLPAEAVVCTPPTRPRSLHPRRRRRACRSSPRAAPRGRRARSTCAGAGPPAPGRAPGAAPAAPRARAASRAPSPRRPAAPDHRAARPGSRAWGAPRRT